MNLADLSPLSGVPGPGGPADVAEISVLVPGWQLAALDNAARLRGLTSGQLVRRLVRDFVTRETGEEFVAEDKLNAACQW